MFTNQKSRIDKVVQNCLSEIRPEVEPYLDADFKSRQGIMNDAYIVGYLEGWSRELIAKFGIKGCHDQTGALMGVYAHLIGGNRQSVSERLLSLYKEHSNTEFQSGRQDGTDRVHGTSIGRQDEVAYLLKHRLAAIS
ncbi:MAG: hypothetical protein HQL71_04465 [Magnetococcales bacterium]|nr:hypothetical protein [Magnetococcales bacterium]